MRKLTKANELLWLLGTVFVALGVSICSKADLGVSMIAAPAFIIYEFLAPLWHGFSVGMIEYLIQGLLLIILSIIIKKFNWRYLLAFLVAIIYGYVLNFFLWVLKDFNISTPLHSWVFLIIGDFITALGVACFFRTTWPLQVYELFVAKVAKTFKITIHKSKWIFDYSLLTISIILSFTLFGDATTFDWSTICKASFHSIGLGTLVTTIINSPIISLMGKLLDKIFENKPLFKNLNDFLQE